MNKIIKRIVFVVLFASMIAWVVAFNSNLSLSPQRAPCTDSDGGINLVLVGTTCDSQGCAQDFCASDLKLAEYSCYKNKKILDNYGCDLGCLDGKCGVEGTAYGLHTISNKLFLTDEINKVRQTAGRTAFPNLLSVRSFNGNVLSSYIPFITIGSSKIVFDKQPTNNSDPKIGISLNTSVNYLYNVTFTFSNNVDFTNTNSIGKNLSLLKRNFVVDNETNATRLVLKEDKKYILENNQPVKFKSFINLSNGTNYFVETPIMGTFVSFSGGFQNINKITFQVFAPSDSQDAILERGYFIDPFFRTFKIDFNGTSSPENSPFRESILVKPSARDKIEISMKDYRNLNKTFNWVLSDGSGNSILADSTGNKINTVEMAKVNLSHYAIIGGGTKGNVIKVLNITNVSNGYKYDVVLLQDLFSGVIHTLETTSEGSGKLVLENSTYFISYTDSDIRVDYPNSLQRDIVIYPPIETYFGAKIMFYEPLTISLDNYLLNSSISSFSVFNGNSYTQIPVVLSSTGFTIGGQNVNPNSSAIINSGKISYEFNYVSPFTTRVFLRDISRNKISNPAIVIFEKADEALIIKIEGLGNSINGVGIDDVEMTWRNNTAFKNLQLSSNPSIYKSIDFWGAMTALDKSNSDQYSIKISHNYEQLENYIYITEIL